MIFCPEEGLQILLHVLQDFRYEKYLWNWKASKKNCECNKIICLVILCNSETFRLNR